MQLCDSTTNCIFEIIIPIIRTLIWATNMISLTILNHFRAKRKLAYEFESKQASVTFASVGGADTPVGTTKSSALIQYDQGRLSAASHRGGGRFMEAGIRPGFQICLPGS